jgi:hypothetical protein
MIIPSGDGQVRPLVQSRAVGLVGERFPVSHIVKPMPRYLPAMGGCRIGNSVGSISSSDLSLSWPILWAQ